MMYIAAALVKKLRERTGAGIVDCKNALIKTEGNIELAIEHMRKSGAIKAVKKANNITSDGVIKAKLFNKCGVLLEINCQTDFVAKNSDFLNFSDKLLNNIIYNYTHYHSCSDKDFESEKVELINKLGEYIKISRITILEGDNIDLYVHGSRIGVLVSTKNVDKILSKQIAMHIAASNPQFIKPEDISNDIFQKEYDIQMEIAIRSGKPTELAKKIVEGRMKKFIKEISLINQPFIIEPNRTINEILQLHHGEVINFVRFELGEDIQQTESNIGITNIKICKQT
ncbi:MAG: elongation factor Ts [Pantoea sp. Brub]|nr:elongation factor Ts [Pantoea sp. Brub]